MRCKRSKFKELLCTRDRFIRLIRNNIITIHHLKPVRFYYLNNMIHFPNDVQSTNTFGIQQALIKLPLTCNDKTFLLEYQIAKSSSHVKYKNFKCM